MICWLPAFLTFYPGIIAYDSNIQTTQAMIGLGAYSKFHPPFHTMVWHVCLQTGIKLNLNPLCIYSLLQMSLLSYVLTKMLRTMIIRNSGKITIFISFLFIAFNPVIAVFALEMTKDAFFAIFFALLALYLLELADNPEKFLSRTLNCLKLITVILLNCLLRNNMIYAFVLCIPILMLIIRTHWKKILVLSVIPLFFFFIINNYVYVRLGVDEGNAAESLSVPIQQIAYTLTQNEEKITAEEKATIDKYIPYDTIIEKYNPRFSDPVKYTFKTENYNQNPSGFWTLWFQLLKKYPVEYVNAFLTLNLPYWYQNADPIDKFSQREYIEIGMDVCDYYPIYADSKLPELRGFYEKVSNYEAFRKIPVLAQIFSLSMPIWLILFTIVSLWAKKAWRKIIVVIPALCLWITYMAGPVSNFRYIFPIFILYPLMLGLITEKTMCE